MKRRDVIDGAKCAHGWGDDGAACRSCLTARARAEHLHYWQDGSCAFCGANGDSSLTGGSACAGRPSPRRATPVQGGWDRHTYYALGMVAQTGALSVSGYHIQDDGARPSSDVSGIHTRADMLAYLEPRAPVFRFDLAERSAAVSFAFRGPMCDCGLPLERIRRGFDYDSNPYHPDNPPPRGLDSVSVDVFVARAALAGIPIEWPTGRPEWAPAAPLADYYAQGGAA